MLYVIGLGLGDEKDITVKGLEAVKGSARVYLESYTSILMVSVEKLESFYGKKVVVADREMVETEADEMLKGADLEDVAFLVSLSNSVSCEFEQFCFLRCDCCNLD